MKLLVVTYSYPPLRSVGSNRWAAMVSHLRKMGHDVTVLTRSRVGEAEHEAGVVRTRDLLSRGPEVGRPLGLQRPALRTRLLVPDSRVLGWLPSALRATRKLLAKQQFDCMVTASPFESTHLLGLALGSERPPWVVDMRDGWTFEPHRPRPPLVLQRKLDRWLEQRVLTEADAVSVVPAAVASEAEQRLGRRVYHVPNGWDPDLESELPTTVKFGREDGRVTLVYTGTLWQVTGQDPTPLFAALRHLARIDPTAARKVRLVMAGPLAPAEARRLESFALDGTVTHVGHLSRLDAVALQRQADVLVLFTSRSRNVVTGKISEYLVSGRPILAVAGCDEARAVVERTRTGLAAPIEDVLAIAQALGKLANGGLGDAYRPQGLDAYVYPSPAQALLEVIEEAVAARDARLIDSV